MSNNSTIPLYIDNEAFNAVECNCTLIYTGDHWNAVIPGDVPASGPNVTKAYSETLTTSEAVGNYFTLNFTGENPFAGHFYCQNLTLSRTLIRDLR